MMTHQMRTDFPGEGGPCPSAVTASGPHEPGSPLSARTLHDQRCRSPGPACSGRDIKRASGDEKLSEGRSDISPLPGSQTHLGVRMEGTGRGMWFLIRPWGDESHTTLARGQNHGTLKRRPTFFNGLFPFPKQLCHYFIKIHE